ncbi:N-acetylmuramoyl-L-alanine amidase [Desulfobacter hydrogenophilus]|uniref:N-acetylmuramoyl-L-alanine amidase n=1 Tax=Desulfobacter hydrogenophilus TaxID=2291 RepID=A0A328FKT0_9BACT|nr:N-acetylmuramoyl-L-alanine amidase [Desulfobacter hydrogenophilus]NDY70665.1 N-acetylmuramoyl-L-alanine amidase [Desulfobacter hydrogenophilus]QBH14028.1 N-acetylmuramoyl-L-alanine amidase [Desulfobacter hydrogenophilus]RAM03555.1 N-acetylmuramoyl-L-alanine amidase [Desulfobacter hydrogenophilus]
MNPGVKRIFTVFIPILICFFLFTWSTETALADAAKKRYLSADTCLKKLKRSTVDINKVSAWLTCIEKYKSIHRDFTGNSWAPAGLYKAAELYFQLAKRSGDPNWNRQADDLIARINRSYPQSAYTARAKTLAAVNASRPRRNNSSVKIKRSQKELTRNDDAIAAYHRQKLVQAEAADTGEYHQPSDIVSDIIEKNTQDPAYCAPATTKPNDTALPPPKGDTTITDLRFWSNPEYTRVVINADREREYAHKLLKKDPALNVPFQRLYVDIDQARLGRNVPDHTPINDDLLKQARAGQFTPHTVRVVVDIKDFDNYKIFSLKDPFRIVIDLWGKNGTVPMDQVAGENTPGTKRSDEKPDRITTDNLKSSDIARQLALGVRKIVIDPGHGGKDPGAPGYIKGVWEKDIVLKLATTLAEKLRNRLNCEVLLTRTTDRKLTLEERTAIANTKRADLFISMHCNAAKSKKLSGIETYILNLATDEQAIAVAARENATSRKNISDLAYILNDLMKHAKIEESTRLANDVHKAMIIGMKKKYTKIRDLGVKQAPFYVLLGARMPAILIESSFLSNKTECKRLTTSSYRNDICNAIADGIEKYINATNPQHI